LAESVRWIQEQQFRRLENREGAAHLVDGVIELLNDDLLPDDLRVDRVDSDGLWLKRGRVSLPLQELSDGYRTVTSLVTDLVKNLASSYLGFSLTSRDGHPVADYPGVVLIDEVEIHLHVSWQTRIGSWLQSHFPRIQFIVSTQSPYVCQSASEHGLIRLPGPTERGGPRAVSEQLYRRIVHGTGDDAVTSELFGVDSLYQVATRQLRDRLTELEGRVALGEASPGEVDEHRRLRDELASSPLSRVRELGSGDEA
jgi:hypothetical protein